MRPFPRLPSILYLSARVLPLGLACLCQLHCVQAIAQAAIHPATPSITPMPGVYTTGRTLTITDATAGVAIHYTLDGSAPTKSSPLYTGPLNIPTAPLTETVRAFATLGNSSGSVASSTFSVAPPSPLPVFSMPQGNYMSAQKLVLTVPTPGGAIHYTVDGSTPTVNSPVYTAPISIAQRETITAFAVAPKGYTQSGSVKQTIGIIPATPFISPATATYSSGQTVRVTDNTPAATLHYTVDGSLPTTASAIYTGPITIPTLAATETVRVIAVLAGVSGSVTSATYKIMPVAPTPTVTPVSGTSSPSPVITIADALAGAQVFYTLDGTTPEASSTPYTGPFELPQARAGTIVLKAVAMKSGYTASGVGQSTITVSLPPGVVAETTVQTGTTLDTISPNFLGFSHEWTAIENIMGDKYVGVNNIYRTLVNTLTSRMGGPLVVRVGGGSTDTSNPATSRTVEPLVELAQETNVKFILGVNLGSDNVSLAQQQASVFLAALPRSSVEAIEIGNEPDGYATNGYRSSSYSYSEFLQQFQRWSAAVSSTSDAAVPVSGPTLGGGGWMSDAQASVKADTLKAALVTQHKYVACYYPGSPLAENILLEPASSTTSMSYMLSTYVPAAHAANMPLRIAEMNSICAGGQPGVSNSFSSALWAIDTMFEYAKLGVDGVNFHSNADAGPYDLFQFSSPSPKYYLLGVNPLYYGLLFFAEAAGGNSHLLASDTVTDSNIKVWVTQNSTGHAHLIIINKELKVSGKAQITLPGYTKGVLETLTAPSYLSTSQVSLAGQTYDGSSDGTLQGLQQTSTIYPADAVWSVEVPPLSAVSVDLQP